MKISVSYIVDRGVAFPEYAELREGNEGIEAVMARRLGSGLRLHRLGVRLGWIAASAGLRRHLVRRSKRNVPRSSLERPRYGR